MLKIHNPSSALKILKYFQQADETNTSPMKSCISAGNDNWERNPHKVLKPKSHSNFKLKPKH